MTREIVLDTETTGTDLKGGDRIIEIGCVELVNGVPSGETFHCYLNPDRTVHPEAFAVHGLSDAFLRDKPRFADIAEAFRAFCGDAKLVIHNAPFDVGFLNAEFSRLGPAGEPLIVLDEVVDTLLIARRKHPNAANNLDALCNRYGIDRSRRTKHGALLDSQILAEVYIELQGGKQASLGLAAITSDPAPKAVAASTGAPAVDAPRRVRAAPTRLTEEDRAAHRSFAGSLGPSAIWTRYLPPSG